MENGVDLVHRESLFNLNDEKVYRLLVPLQNINRVVAFTNQNLVLFRREKLRVSSVAYRSATEFKWCIEKRNVFGEQIPNDLGANLYSFKDFLYLLSILYFKSFEPRILECSVIAFGDVLLLSLFFQVTWYLFDWF